MSLKVTPIDDDAAAPIECTPPPTRSDLSPDQGEAYDAIAKWIECPTERGYVTLGGLAGTGKTTLVATLADALAGSRRVVFTAFTGKAVDVLGKKLRAFGITAPCVTLHSLLYWPRMDENGALLGWTKKPVLGENLGDGDWLAYDLVVVDEASMLSAELWSDLLSFDKPIVAVGDHGQLPPVGSGSISLMETPDLRLEKIHRQAAGNPIIALAHAVRTDGANVLRGFRGGADERVRIIGGFRSAIDVVAQGGLDAAALCYFNRTRVAFNAQVRAARGYAGPEVVICLKNTEKTLYNGMRGYLRAISNEPNDRDLARNQRLATFDFPDARMRVEGLVQLDQFGREKTIASPADIGLKGWSQVGLLFDYGYALTTHKAQGSQWDRVVVKYETLRKDTEDTRRRWLYTSITRAVSHLYVIP